MRRDHPQVSKMIIYTCSRCGYVPHREVPTPKSHKLAMPREIAQRFCWKCPKCFHDLAEEPDLEKATVSEQPKELVSSQVQIQ